MPATRAGSSSKARARQGPSAVPKRASKGKTKAATTEAGPKQGRSKTRPPAKPVRSTASAVSKRDSQAATRSGQSGQKAPVPSNASNGNPAADNSAVLLGIAQTLECLSERFDQLGGVSCHWFTVSTASQKNKQEATFPCRVPATQRIQVRGGAAASPAQEEVHKVAQEKRTTPSNSEPGESSSDEDLQMLQASIGSKGHIFQVCHPGHRGTGVGRQVQFSSCFGTNH